MIEAFVLAELDSTRHGGNHYLQLAAGDLSRYRGSSPLASALRRVALFLFRGYGWNEALFRGFPTDVTWKLVAVPIAELREWLYAHEDTWLTLSQNSRLVRDGAANVENVENVQQLRYPNLPPIPNVPEIRERVRVASECILAIERDVKNRKTYPPIIAAALNESSPHIIAEGHSRATAYIRARELDAEIEVIVGYSPGLATWHYYGRP